MSALGKALQSVTTQRATLFYAALNWLGVFPDVALAHSSFYRSRMELVPLFVSVGAGLVTAMCGFFDLSRVAVRAAVLVAAGSSIATGVVGLTLHAGAETLRHPELHTLVYSAPIVAPLTFSGFGLVAIVAIFVRSREERGRALELLAALGFFGNFLLCLLDHAQNGFWAPVEWISVGAGALGGMTLLASAVYSKLSPRERSFVWFTLALMVVVSLVGTTLHLRADLRRVDVPLLDRFRYGAPIFAPLLFADIALLGALGRLAREFEA